MHYLGSLAVNAQLRASWVHQQRNPCCFQPRCRDPASHHTGPQAAQHPKLSTVQQRQKATLKTAHALDLLLEIPWLRFSKNKCIKRAMGGWEEYSSIHNCWLVDEVQAGSRVPGCGSDVAAAFLLLERNPCCHESTVLEQWLYGAK